MGALLLVFVELVLDVIVEVVLGVLLDIFVSMYQAAFDRANWSTLAAILGYLLLGGTAASASLYIWPTRLLPAVGLPGLSLALGPLCTGWALAAWGDARRSRGHATSNLATFSGGAALAFGAALVRFIWAR